MGPLSNACRPHPAYYTMWPSHWTQWHYHCMSLPFPEKLMVRGNKRAQCSEFFTIFFTRSYSNKMYLGLVESVTCLSCSSWVGPLFFWKMYRWLEEGRPSPTWAWRRATVWATCELHQREKSCSSTAIEQQKLQHATRQDLHHLVH